MKAKNIGADFIVTARGFVRSGIGLFFSLVFPIVLIGLFGLIFSTSGSPPTLYVLNEDHGSAGSLELLHVLGETKAVSLTEVTGTTAANFSTYLSDHSYSIGLLIPAGFGAALGAHQPVNLTLYDNPGDAASTGAALGALQASTNYLNLQAANGTPFVGYATSQVGGVSYSYIDYLVPGLIGFTVLTSPMFAMVDITSSYRKEGLFRQLSLTPLTRAEWLTAKILWYSLVTLASAAIMIAMGYLVFGAKLQIGWWILPFLFIGPFLFVSLGMLAGSAAKTPESAAILGNIITFPMMFLSGTFFPVNSFPGYLQTFAHILPLYYVIDGLEAVMLYSNGARALLDLAVLVVLAVLFFLGAIIAFRWREP
jgi:ABC-2 type transport system permease protein